MDTMNYSDPDSFKEPVQPPVTEEGHRHIGEYIGELVRAGQMEKARAVLEAEILKGIRSGPSVPMTEEDWQEIRNEVRQRFEARRNGLSRE